uniref:alpha-1,2-Mannosidase n=1 Tax=Angiostrongylus cantonensis TaxID=6313 RepID=A0A158P5Y7_ANGCA
MRQTSTMQLAEELGRTCHESYIRTATHIGPEMFYFREDDEATSNYGENGYILRPEVIEGYFYLWRLTGKEKYRDWVWDAITSIDKYCRVEGGFAGLHNVYDPTKGHDDVQQSFFLAETLKYAYLTFTDKSVISLDQWVFNTEAHPLPIMDKMRRSLKSAAEFKSKADSSPNWARPVEINSCKSTVTSFVASAVKSEYGITPGQFRMNATKVREMKLGDDPFPKPKSRTSKSREIAVEASSHLAVLLANTFLINTPSVPQVPMSYRYGDLPSGCQLVLGNKNNKGKLIIDDKPFWTEQRKPTDEDLEESDTDDELQMSAEVALDVYEGKVKLVNMPTVPVVLDPMNELCELQRRDKLFYSKDVLFGNSVRSMINLCDNSMNVAPIKRRSKSELRDCLFDIVKEPFIPRSKKYISRKSSRKRKKRSGETERNKGENKDLRKKASPTDQGKDQKSGIETRALETLKYADEQRQYGEMYNENSKQQLSLDLPKEDLTTKESGVFQKNVPPEFLLWSQIENAFCFPWLVDSHSFTNSNVTNLFNSDYQTDALMKSIMNIAFLDK